MSTDKSKNFGDHIAEAFARAARGFARAMRVDMATGDTPSPAGKDKSKGPKLVEIKLKKLKPTQICVGMKQVELKQDRLKKLAKDKKDRLDDFITERPIRVVMGPEGDAYIIDHHHLGLALMREGHTTAPVEVVADYSGMTVAAFWKKMDEMNYVYPYDDNGKKRAIGEIPDSLLKMKDDPYRALAGFARNEGAFKKDWTPFAEFKWADYFRNLIPRADIDKDFDKALKKAVELAKNPAASHLPGYIPPKKPPAPEKK